MTLMRWDPWRELETMRRSLDRIFQDWHPFTDNGVANLALDIAEKGDSFVVKASLPGVNPDDVDISVTGRNLTIQVETKGEEEAEEDPYLMRERFYGAMSCSILLLAEVEEDKAKAEYKNGVLHLTLPKAAAERSRKIQVQKAA